MFVCMYTILPMIRLSAATLSCTLFRDLQATNEIPLRLVFMISGIGGMTDWWVDRDDVTTLFRRRKLLS